MTMKLGPLKAEDVWFNEIWFNPEGDDIPSDMPPSPEKVPFECEQTDFRLSAVVPCPIMFKVLTTLPTKEFLAEIESLLSPGLVSAIFNCFLNIYNPVALRNPTEGADFFFHHSGATVHYEEENNLRIKNKNHTIKAVDILNMVENTIKQLDKTLKKTDHKKRSEILEKTIKLLKINYNALVDALQKANTETKGKIEVAQKLIVDALERYDLSDEDKAIIRKLHPASPLKRKRLNHDSPEERLTPKKLRRPEDVDSIAALSTAKKSRRQLNFDDLPPSPIRVDLDDTHDPEDDLAQMMDKSILKKWTPSYSQIRIPGSPHDTTEKEKDSSYDDSDLDLNSFTFKF